MFALLKIEWISSVWVFVINCGICTATWSWFCLIIIISSRFTCSEKQMTLSALLRTLDMCFCCNVKAVWYNYKLSIFVHSIEKYVSSEYVFFRQICDSSLASGIVAIFELLQFEQAKMLAASDKNLPSFNLKSSPKFFWLFFILNQLYFKAGAFYLISVSVGVFLQLQSYSCKLLDQTTRTFHIFYFIYILLIQFNCQIKVLTFILLINFI